MNSHLKQFLKGILILFWMIVYWFLVGLVPQFFIDFNDEYHHQIFYSSIFLSFWIYLFLIYRFYLKDSKKSFKVILLISLPYLLFFLSFQFLQINIPRLLDIAFLFLGILFIYFTKNTNIGKRIVLLSLYCLLLIPMYLFSYNNVLYYINKSKLTPNATLDKFDLRIIDQKGNSFNLSEFKGQTICIDMWASSCGNCISSMPEFEKLNIYFKNDKEYKIISLYCPVAEEQTYEWFKKYIIRKFDYNIDYYYIEYENFNKLNIRQFPEFLIINKKSNLIYRGQISYLPYVNDNIYNKLKSINENY